MSPIKLTREEIKKLVFDIKSLDQSQRSTVQETLVRLAHSADGHISPEELRKALYDLRQDDRISELDGKAVISAVFGE